MAATAEFADVTVIVPARRAAATIDRALASVAAQTLRPAAVVVVDDGSDDGTDDAALRWKERLKGAVLTVFRQPHAGAGAARNRALKEAKTEFVAFLDADDEWLPEKLARQHAALETDPTALLCHTEEIWVRNGVRVNPMKKHAKRGGRIFEPCLLLCCMSPSSVVTPSSVILQPSPSSAKPRFSIHMGSNQLKGT